MIVEPNKKDEMLNFGTVYLSGWFEKSIWYHVYFKQMHYVVCPTTLEVYSLQDDYKQFANVMAEISAHRLKG